jgi:hypothetical protein
VYVDPSDTTDTVRRGSAPVAVQLPVCAMRTLACPLHWALTELYPGPAGAVTHEKA